MNTKYIINIEGDKDLYLTATQRRKVTRCKNHFEVEVGQNTIGSDIEIAGKVQACLFINTEGVMGTISAPCIVLCNACNNTFFAHTVGSIHLLCPVLTPRLI